MERDMLKCDLERVRLGDEAKRRIVETVLGREEVREAKRPRYILRPAAAAGLLAILLVGVVLLFLLPGLRDRSERAGGTDDFFAGRYFALIELDGSAYVYRGDGTLHRFDGTGALREIGRLKTGQLLSDGLDLFFAQGREAYQIAPDLTGKTRLLREADTIELDYVTDEFILYHFGNHDRYTLFARKTGAKKTLFTETEAKNYMFQDGAGDVAVFVHAAAGGEERLVAVRLSDGQETALAAGSIRGRAVISDGKAFFTRTGEPVDRTYDRARELWSVGLDGEGLRQVDVSAIPYDSIRAIAATGTELVIAAEENVLSHQGRIVRFDPEDGSFTLLQERVGLIDRLFATEHYYSYYDLGIGDVAGKAFVGPVRD